MLRLFFSSLFARSPQCMKDKDRAELELADAHPRKVNYFCLLCFICTSYIITNKKLYFKNYINKLHMDIKITDSADYLF